jgi:hypothetical protein
MLEQNYLKSDAKMLLSQVTSIFSLSKMEGNIGR